MNPEKIGIMSLLFLMAFMYVFGYISGIFAGKVIW